MIAIFKREFRSYFINVSGYLFAAILLLFTGIFTTGVNLLGQYAAFEYALQSVLLIFLLIIPILAMRSIAEDKHTGTDSLLYSLPLKLSSVVIGKYLAMLAVLLLPILIMGIYPLILSAFGNVSLIGSYTGLLGLFLLGAALIAVCMFASSLTESQVIAAVLGFGFSLLFYFMKAIASMIPTAPAVSLVALLVIAVLVALLVYYLGRSIAIALAVGGILGAVTLGAFLISPASFEGLVVKLLQTLAIFDRFSAFSQGLLDFGAIVYYLSFAAFFVFLTIQSLEKKRFS